MGMGERGGVRKKRAGHSSRSTPRLDVLTALHLWFVLGGLHLDVDHVVAGRHVALLALRHLLLGDDPINLWRRRKNTVEPEGLT